MSIVKAKCTGADGYQVCENCDQRDNTFYLVAGVRLCEKCYGKHKPGIAWMIREYLQFVKNHTQRPRLVMPKEDESK